MFEAISDLFSFRAFRAHENDVTVPIRERFAGKTVIGVSWGKLGIRSARMSFSKDGVLEVTDVEYQLQGKTGYEIDHLRSLYARHKTTNVALMIGHDYFLTPSDKVAQVTDQEALNLIRTAPDRLTGLPPEPNHSYSVIYHPLRASRWHMACTYTLPTLRAAEDIVRRSGGNLVRLQASGASVLRYLVDTLGMDLFQGDLLFLDHNYVCILQQTKGEWEKDKVFFRCESNKEFALSVRDMLQRSCRPDVPLLVVNVSQLDVKEIISRLYPALDTRYDVVPPTVDFMALGHL